MIKLRFFTNKIQKTTLILFATFSFCHTSYFVSKMEKGVALILKTALPSSYVFGIKPLSLTRWHIETIYFKHSLLGTYEAKEVFFDLKLWPLLLGKCHLESLVIKELEIFQDPHIPLDLTLFNSLYQNRFFLISKLHIASLITPILPHSISVNFLRKPNLNFLEIYDSNSASHSSFEIASHSPFLKFNTDITIDLPQDSTICLKGTGFIKDSLNLDLKGACGFSGSNAIHPIDLSLKANDRISLEGTISSDKIQGKFSFIDSYFASSITLKNLETLLPESELIGDLNISLKGPLNSLEGSIDSNKFFFKRKALAPLEIKIPELKNNNIVFEGSFKQNTVQQINTSGHLFLNKNELISTVCLHSEALEASIKGSLLDKKPNQLLIEAKINDLNFFEGFFEKLPLSGQAHLYLKYKADAEAMEIFSHASHLKIGSYFLDKASLSFLNQNSEGHLKLELDKVFSPFAEPFLFRLEAEKNHQWDGLFEFKNRICDFQALGSYQKNSRILDIKIQDIAGVLKDHPLFLSKPFQILKNDELLTISPFSIKSQNLDIQGHFEENHKELLIKNLSLEGFKIPYFDANLEGLFCCHLDIRKDQDSQCELDIKNLKIKDPTASFSPIHIQGKCIQNTSKKNLIYDLNAYFSNDDFIFAQGSIPLSKNDSFLSSHHFVNFKYDLKDLGKVINMGACSIGGQIYGDLNLHGEFNNLSTFGHIQVQKLHAGFPLLGIFLDQGILDIKPSGKTADFELKISDLDAGYGFCQGLIDLNNFSYSAKCELDKIFVSFKNIFSSKASGTCFAKGDFSKIKGTGNLNLEKSGYELSHPEIKKTLSYEIEKVTKDLPIKSKSLFKYDLMFDLTTRDPCKIKGIGLDSDWEGKSLCHIANSIFSLKGSLHCKKGEYKFNTKKFNIDEGVIHLEDSGPSTILAKGSLEIPDYQIKVSLVGPLNSPTLQFSSLPYLNENAIFSYILFNKPISELHPFQSIELAQTLMELTGDKSPVSLSKIRSNLSIDAFDIRTSSYDQNKISLHVGKYITPSFLIGLNQTTKASDLLLQLEFKHGFILKAESQEQKEGKLSFKWRKSF